MCMNCMLYGFKALFVYRIGTVHTIQEFRKNRTGYFTFNFIKTVKSSEAGGFDPPMSPLYTRCVYARKGASFTFTAAQPFKLILLYFVSGSKVEKEHQYFCSNGSMFHWICSIPCEISNLAFIWSLFLLVHTEALIKWLMVNVACWYCCLLTSTDHHAAWRNRKL